MATGTLSLILPVAASGVKLALDETAYNAIEEQLDFGKRVIDAVIGEGTKIGDWMGASATARLEHGEAIRAERTILREFQALIKAKDPGFGGLVRVMNKRQEFLWVHPQFEGKYWAGLLRPRPLNIIGENCGRHPERVFPMPSAATSVQRRVSLGH